MYIVLDAAGEVATPVLFGVTIIIIVFLPLMTLREWKARCLLHLPIRSPSRSASPCCFRLRSRPYCAFTCSGGVLGRRYPTVKLCAGLYNAMLQWALSHRKITVLSVIALFIFALCLFPFLGTSSFPRWRKVLLAQR